MTIGNSFKKAINNAFMHVVFKGRDKETILKTLATKVHGSGNVSIIPSVECIKVERLDDLHDKVTIGFDDYEIQGVITWRPCEKGDNVVFIGYE